jgi:ribosomal 50S subunit-recycling heat shock protein
LPSLRLDLFLKWSRIIPRRSLARATCDAGRVVVNGEIARAARSVRVDDVLDVALPTRDLRVRVRSLPGHPPSKTGATDMVEVLANGRRESPNS